MKNKYGFLRQIRKTVDYWRTLARMEFLADLDQLLKEEGISQSELARRMGTSQPYIAKALGGNSNFTLLTMVKFALALDAALHVRLTKREETLERKRPELASERSSVHHYELGPVQGPFMDVMIRATADQSSETTVN